MLALFYATNTLSGETHLSFEDLGVDKRIASQLSHIGITTPTDIQQQAVPVAIAGHDLLAQSKTGSGKTFAFLLPAITRLSKQKALSKRDPRALIITPTRELANQVYKQLTLIIAGTGLKATKIVGGDNYNDQVKALSKDPQFVVATPGRLVDHLDDRNFYLEGLELLILDEADRVLELGFKEQIEKINTAANHRLRQTLFFSATLEHAEVDALSRNLLKNPKRVTIDASTQEHNDITQKFFLADHLDHKIALLIAATKSAESGQQIVFTATRDDTVKLSEILEQEGYKTLALSGDMNQSKRNSIMDAFSRGQAQILVTTDVASRGLDLLNVSQVINFDLPKQAEEYVHRIGRTGRAGFKGNALSLVSAKDWQSFKAIESYLSKRIGFSEIDGLVGKFKGFKEKTHQPKQNVKAKSVNQKTSKHKKPFKKPNKAKTAKAIPAPFDVDGVAPLKRRPKKDEE